MKFIESVNYGVKLNDKRLGNRFTQILDQLSQTPGSSIPQAFQNKREIKATYRFFHNKKVNSDKLLSAHCEGLERKLDETDAERLLCLSDSTELDYTNKRSANNLGPLTYKKQRGMLLHNSIITTGSGVPYGIMDQSYIIRSDEGYGKTNERRYLPIEEKESVKWLNHFKKAQDYCCKWNKEIVFIGDREADIMDLYHAKKHDLMHYVIRSRFNRCLNNNNHKLYEVLDKQSESGRYEIELINPLNMKKRKALLAVRFCSAEIKISNGSKYFKRLGPVTVNAIEVKEVNASAEIEHPVHWRLLTSLSILDFSTAREIIQYYVFRWIIERFHFALKSGGAKIEQLQIEKTQPLKNAITTYSIITMDVLKIKYLAENTPDKNIYEAGISKKEHEVLYNYAQAKGLNTIPFDGNNPPTVYDFCRILGKVGGFIPSKRQPLPGLKILSRAMEKFYLLIDVYDAFMSKN